MKILGISAHYHDSAAAFIIDGVPVAAVQEERLSRRKNDAAFPRLAIDWCLEHAGIEPQALDAVVFYERPMLKFPVTLAISQNNPSPLCCKGSPLMGYRKKVRNGCRRFSCQMVLLRK